LQLLAACFQRSSTAQLFPLWSEPPNLPFVRPACQDKNRFGSGTV
jgi:hypothetical protein